MKAFEFKDAQKEGEFQKLLSEKKRESMKTEIKKDPIIVYDEPREQPLPQAAIEASLKGDWGSVHVTHRIAFVKQLCDSLSIPLVMNPFLFIQMKGKTTLYAPASAFHMIGNIKKISCEIVSREVDKDLQLYEVSVRASTPDGRFSDNMAAVTLKGLSGEDYSNAKMKCITKAQRRAIKSLIGLPIPDEDDVELRDAQIMPLTVQAEQAPSSHSPSLNLEIEKQPTVSIDEETKEWRNTIADLMLGEYSPFNKNRDAAAGYVKTKTGKTLKDLNAQELEQLHSDFMEEFFPSANEPTEQKEMF
jgi:hypothetical protein